MNQDNKKAEEKLSKLFQQASNERSPSSMDESILTAARQAIKKEKMAKNVHSRYWMMPLSTAAMLVLVVGLVSFIQQQVPDQLVIPAALDNLSKVNNTNEIEAIADSAVADSAIASVKDKSLPAINEKDKLRTLSNVKKSIGDTPHKKLSSINKNKIKSPKLKRSIATVEEERKLEKPILSPMKQQINQKKFTDSAVGRQRHPETPKTSSQQVPVEEMSAKTEVVVNRNTNSTTEKKIANVHAKLPKVDFDEPSSGKAAAVMSLPKTGKIVPQAAMPMTGLLSTKPSLYANQIDKESKANMSLNCELLPEIECLQSELCNLILDENLKRYVCVKATNECEKGFKQAPGALDLCNNKPGCQFIHSKCYCPPGLRCICGGGPPARCIKKKIQN